MSSLEKWWKKIWADLKAKFKGDDEDTVPVPQPPTDDQADPPDQDDPPSEDGMTDAEADAIIASLQFLDGTPKSDPSVKRLVRMYGRRITHFGGGNKQPPVESALWKPASDSDGKLVVITPSSKRADFCMVGSEKKTSLSIGNGWRPHFRFSKPGASGYGSKPVVTVGGVGSASIASPSKKQSFKLSGTSTPPADVPTDQPTIEDKPSYAPGKVVIPLEFTRHGAIRELRFQRCSVANGKLKLLHGLTYQLPLPTDPDFANWTAENGGNPAFGCKAKFGDGTVFDGYVHDYRGSYPMPVQKIGHTSGRAFWVQL